MDKTPNDKCAIGAMPYPTQHKNYKHIQEKPRRIS